MVIQKKKTLTEISIVGAEVLGVITGFVEIADADLLLPTEDLDVEVHVDFGAGDLKKGQDKSAGTVTKKIC